MPAEAMIRLRGVEKVFPGTSRPAVTDLSFEVAEGEVVVLVGPSGCGKTTTLKMINRLIEPTGGPSRWPVGMSWRWRRPLFRRSIGYVIQQIGLFPHKTIAENIATVPRLLGWDKGRIGERVDELIDLVDLEVDMRDRYPSSYQGAAPEGRGGESVGGRPARVADGRAFRSRGPDRSGSPPG